MKKQNDEITVRSLLDIFIPKLWIAVIVAIVFGIAFGIYSSAKKDTYTSSGLYMFSKTNYNNEDMQTGLTAAEVEAMQAMIANGKEIINTTKFARSVYAGLMLNDISEISATDASGEKRDIVAQNVYNNGEYIHIAYAIDATLDEASRGEITVTYKLKSGESVTLETATLLDSSSADATYIDGDVERPIYITKGKAFSEQSAKSLRNMMSVSLSADDTTCYYLNVTSSDPTLSRDIAIVAGAELVKIYENTKYAIEIILLDDPAAADAPNSKNVSRNAIIGFVGGFLLSLLVIFVASRFDVVIRSREKLEENFDIPILGVIPRIELTDLQQRNGAGRADK